MDTCTSIFFNSQIDEILEDIELVRLCDEVEEADLFTHCFLEDYQHEGVENHKTFRYVREGRNVGTIPGVNSTRSNPTYPTIEIKLCGYRGHIAVFASCVTSEEPYRPHPHNLEGEHCRGGVCELRVKASSKVDSCRVQFRKIGIRCMTRNEVAASIDVRRQMHVDPFNTGFDGDGLDLNTVRLCFQVFFTNEKTWRRLPPVVSDIMFKEPFLPLRITESSADTGTVAGGTKVILLCKKLTYENTEVWFFQEENGVEVWSSRAHIKKVHLKGAIVLYTPPYRDQEVNHHVNVQIRLQVPDSLDNAARSNPWDFEYIPKCQDKKVILEKRQKTLNYKYYNLNDCNRGATDKKVIQEKQRKKLKNNLNNFIPTSEQVATIGNLPRNPMGVAAYDQVLLDLQQPYTHLQQPLPPQQQLLDLQQPLPPSQQPLPYSQQTLPYSRQQMPPQQQLLDLQQPLPSSQQPLPYSQQTLPHSQLLPPQQQSPHSQLLLPPQQKSPHSQLLLSQQQQSPHSQLLLPPQKQSPHSQLLLPPQQQSPHSQLLLPPQQKSPHSQLLLPPKQQSPHSQLLLSPQQQSPHLQLLLSPHQQSPHSQLLLPPQQQSPHSQLLLPPQQKSPHSQLLLSPQQQSPHSQLLLPPQQQSPHSQLLLPPQQQLPHLQPSPLYMQRSSLYLQQQDNVANMPSTSLNYMPSATTTNIPKPSIAYSPSDRVPKVPTTSTYTPSASTSTTRTNNGSTVNAASTTVTDMPNSLACMPSTSLADEANDSWSYMSGTLDPVVDTDWLPTLLQQGHADAANMPSTCKNYIPSATTIDMPKPGMAYSPSNRVPKVSTTTSTYMPSASTSTTRTNNGSTANAASTTVTDMPNSLAYVPSTSTGDMASLTDEANDSWSYMSGTLDPVVNTDWLPTLLQQQGHTANMPTTSTYTPSARANGASTSMTHTNNGSTVNAASTTATDMPSSLAYRHSTSTTSTIMTSTSTDLTSPANEVEMVDQWLASPLMQPYEYTQTQEQEDCSALIKDLLADIKKSL